MGTRALILILVTGIGVVGCLNRSYIILPGDRLEVKFGGSGDGTVYWANEIGEIDTNGNFPIAESSHVRLEGLSLAAATNAVSRSFYIERGKTNTIKDVSIRKIAPIPAPLSLQVFPNGESNLIFRVTNGTTNSFRIPTAGYAPSGIYFSINTNPAYAINLRERAHVGLFLTYDWRYVGTNWFFASRQQWKKRLKIRTLKPGQHIDITREIDPFTSDLLTNTNDIVEFNFQIPQEWAESYGLWEGDVFVSGLTEIRYK